MKINKTVILLVLFILTVLYPGQRVKSQSSTIKINITNIKSLNGEIKAILWNSSVGFPKEKDRYYKRTKQKVNNDTIEICFDNIPFGDYAISFFQDENENMEFDRNRWKRTSEPFGLSGKPDFEKRPVKFDDCKFTVNKAKMEIHIPMLYIEDVQQLLQEQ
ncbi:MAG: hypothetical protein B6D61_02870 [Bacteroidetes bacterium 4484_249]|nr:MAG: hypothetical protein B6D61_02870 [Bacteroidetes bacterium 4484_249]